MQELSKNQKSVAFRLLFALTSALILVGAFIILTQKFPVTDFRDTVLSMPSARNVDEAKNVRFYYTYVLLLLPLFCYSAIKTFGLKLNFEALQETRLKKLEGDSFFCGILVLSWILLNLKSAYMLSVGAVLVIALLFYRLRFKKENCSLLSLYATFFLVYSESFCFTVPLVSKFNPLVANLAYFVVGLLLAGGIYLLSDREKYSGQTKYALFPFALFPIFEWLLIEIMYTLRTYGIMLSAYLLTLPFLASCAISAIRFFACKEEKETKHFFDFAAVGFALLGNVRVLVNNYKVDFFEDSNHGRAIYDMIHGLGLPLIDNFDAHMLSSSIGGFIYHLLNNDDVGALFGPYGYILTGTAAVIGIYFLLKCFVKKEYAFLAIALAPLNQLGGYIGLLFVPYLLYWRKHANFKTDIALAILFLWTCLFKLDVGVSFGMAGVVCAILYLCFTKSKKDVFRLLCAGAFVAGIFLAGLFAFFAVTGRDFGEFFSNFMTASLSNQHWGCGQLVNMDKGRFPLLLKIAAWTVISGSVYIILPIIFTLCTIRLVKVGKEKLMQDEKAFFVVYFVLAYIFNIQRTIIRHTIASLSSVAYGITFLLMLVFALYFLPKLKRTVPALLFLLLSLFCVGKSFIQKKDFPAPTNPLSTIHGVTESLRSERTSARTIREQDLQYIREARKFVSLFFPEDEKTFLDFTNDSLLYAFTDKRHPAYVNQSPGMVNGKKGQLQFLNQVKEKDIPFVFMPLRIVEKEKYFNFFLDKILNSDRYYLIAEYICENYEPLCSFSDTAVWCRKSEHDDLEKKARGEGYDILSTYDYCDEKCYVHDLDYIPGIWGEYAAEKTADLERLSESLSESENKIPADVLGKECYLILKVNADRTSRAKIIFSSTEFSKPVEYNFNLTKGTKYYRIRVSSEIAWYSGKLEKFTLNIPSNASVEDIYFAKAETEALK